MAYLRQAKTPEEIKALTVNNVKKAYNDLAEDYNKLINLDVVYCPCCGEFKAASQFYSSKRTKSGLEHLGCKSCILNMATDFDKKTQVRKDNREKTIEVFKKMDLPFIEKDYTAQLRFNADATNEKIRETAFQQYLVMVKSLSQYKGKTFAHSEFLIDDIEVENNPEDIRIVQKTLRSAKKRFGGNFSNEELMFLENEYQDWIKRYTCENKSQEILFKNICFTELNIDKAQKEGRDTKDLTKTLQDLMASLQIKPSQSNSNALTEAKTFGELIQKWENEKPIPEPEDEFKDVDKIGLYIDVFFKGHLAKMMGLKNGLSSLYDRFIQKYTVKKPQYDEDSDSEALFDQIFGKRIDDE